MSKMEKRRRRNRLTVCKNCCTKGGNDLFSVPRNQDNKPGVQILLRRKNFLMVKKIGRCWH